MGCALVIINAEHLGHAGRAGIVDLSAFTIFDVVGAERWTPQSIVVAQSDAHRPVIYTFVLDGRGGSGST